jgi:hypothetical protein
LSQNESQCPTCMDPAPEKDRSFETLVLAC